MTASGLRIALLALLGSACNALQVGLTPLARAATRSPVVNAQLVEGPANGSKEAADDDDKGDDRIMFYDENTDPLGKSEFVKWYRYEKAVAQYEKENPRDVLKEAWAKLSGPLTSLAVLAGGFYAIPLVKGIKEGIDSGDFFESVAASLESPTTALDGGECCTQNLARLPCMPRLFPCPLIALLHRFPFL